jgi:hypothetical protein
MELQYNFEEEQTPSRDFVQGFNHAELLADLAPEVLEDISPVNNPESDYFNGFFSAKVHIREEARQQHELEAMETLRSKSQVREIDFERE